MQGKCFRPGLAALTLALGLTPALAAEGRVPLWTQSVLGPGSPQGRYVVTRDIVVAAGAGPALSIVGGPGFEHADIDLNGFTIVGDPAGAPTIEVLGMESVTIRNGEVRAPGPGDAVFVVGCRKAVLEDVKTTAGDIGINLEATSNFVLRRNVVVDTNAIGIRIVNGGAPDAIEGVIEDNLVSGTGAEGIVIEGPFASVAVNENRVEETGFTGVSALGGEGLLVALNNITRTGGEGLLVEATNNGKIYNNVISGANDNGILLIALGGFLVLDNVSSSNGRSGILVDGFLNHIDRNTTNFNGVFGLHFGPGSADNTYGRNMARGNAGAAPCAFVVPVEPCAGIGGGGGSFAPNFCNESGIGIGNTSHCDNLMPGPPLS